MSGLIGAMNTALSGIEAFEAGINTVSENLTNAATPGYAVETVNLSTAVANANQPGTGVETPQIARAADGFVAGVLRTANSAGAAATVMSTSLSNISNALQDDGDVQSAMNQFFTDVAALAADPYVASPGTLQANGSVVDNNAGQLTAGNDTVTSTPAAGAAVVPANYYGQTLQITFTSSSAYNVETTANPPTVVASGSLSGGNGTIAVAYPAGAASGNYWQLPISGTPAAGDTLTLQPGGPSSGSNATRMAAIWTSPGTSSQGTLQTAAVGLNTSLGANAQEAATLATSSASQVTAATTSLQTISGVSPDQQAVLLANYQQSYQAAAQVIAAANTMFNSLLSAVQ